MSLPYEFLLFAIVFFGFMAVGSAVQAHRKKEKVYYIGSIGGFSLVFVCVLILLYQFILAAVLMVGVFVLSAVALPTSMKVQRREIAKQVKRVNLSTPLKIRDFFTWKWGLKLANKWGVWKTAGIYCLIMMPGVAGGYYILSIYGLLRTESVVTYSILFTIFNSVWWHNMLSTALKESQLSKPSTQNLNEAERLSQP